MRIFAALVLLGLAASCTAPPPQSAAPGAVPTASAIAALLGPPAPVPLLPPPAPAPAMAMPVAAAEPAAIAVAAVPAPPPPAAPLSTVDWVPLPRVWFEMFRDLYGPGPAGRLTLSNFSFDTARVQVALTNGPDCAAADPAAATDFLMPLNATRIIAPPPGADICWRRELPPPPPPQPEPAQAGQGPGEATAAQAMAAQARAVEGMPPAGAGWAGWNRAYTASGRFIDSRL